MSATQTEPTVFVVDDDPEMRPIRRCGIVFFATIERRNKREQK